MYPGAVRHYVERTSQRGVRTACVGILCRPKIQVNGLFRRGQVFNLQHLERDLIA